MLTYILVFFLKNGGKQFTKKPKTNQPRKYFAREL